MSVFLCLAEVKCCG